mmetsp:Transcript_20318/g.36168  ORF Transcript_20318/g.36168 Transcript_20318/m.36168 type:complete len:283 (-) Transcript_20318:589-1437(-)
MLLVHLDIVPIVVCRPNVNKSLKSEFEKISYNVSSINLCTPVLKVLVQDTGVAIGFDYTFSSCLCFFQAFSKYDALAIEVFADEHPLVDLANHPCILYTSDENLFRYVHIDDRVCLCGLFLGVLLLHFIVPQGQNEGRIELAVFGSCSENVVTLRHTALDDAQSHTFTEVVLMVQPVIVDIPLVTARFNLVDNFDNRANFLVSPTFNGDAGLFWRVCTRVVEDVVQDKIESHLVCMCQHFRIHRHDFDPSAQTSHLLEQSHTIDPLWRRSKAIVLNPHCVAT